MGGSFHHVKLKEILSCYVSERVPKPRDLVRLRQSFIDNGFSETEVSSQEWRYKRGAPVALEFDYNSEAIEIQILLKDLGETLLVSVGNWGFPFEPLMSKKRYQATLARVVREIDRHGMLTHDAGEASRAAALAARKRNEALWAVVFIALAAVLFRFLSRT